MKKIEELAAEKYISEQNLPERKRTPAENYIDWSQFGAREAQRWIPIDEELPPEDNQDILLKNEKWIDEDYNINGVRIGCYGDGKWYSASWCCYHDEYHTRNSEIDDEGFHQSKAEDQVPTHWRPIERC